MFPWHHKPRFYTRSYWTPLCLASGNHPTPNRGWSRQVGDWGSSLIEEDFGGLFTGVSGIGWLGVLGNLGIRTRECSKTFLDSWLLRGRSNPLGLGLFVFLLRDNCLYLQLIGGSRTEGYLNLSRVTL